MTDLNNKVVFITGASSGIGAACADAFASKGAALVLCARREDRLQELALALTKEYDVAVHCLPLDITNLDSVNNAIKNLPENWQNIEVLVNNAGLAAGTDKMQEANIEDWQTMINTNVNGLLNVTHAILPGMVFRNSGHILNMGSVAGHEVYPGGAIYCATKHAVDAITKGLKLDLCGTPLRVSSIDPGLVSTDFSAVRFKGDAERAEKVYSGMTPLTAADIADIVLFIATRPSHVNICDVVVFPTDQSSATVVHRKES